MSKERSAMNLGPLTRQALVDAGVDQRHIDGIAAGSYEWLIGRAPAIGISHNEERATATARAIAERKDFRIEVRRTEATQRAEKRHDFSLRARRAFVAAIPNRLGQGIANARRYEEALSQRGDVGSVMFLPGTLDDWTSVAHAPSWDTLAFEFRRAAAAVAATHSAEIPAPALVLLALCRHHLELALKSIIMAGDRLVGNPVSLPGTHPLTPLWDRAMPLMRGAWKDGWDDAEASATGKVIQELDQVDRSGMATRYPVDRENIAFQRPSTLVNFSVADFMAAFTRAADFLGTGSLWIEIELRVKDEGPTTEDVAAD